MGKFPVLLLLVGALAACSVKRTAVDIVGNAISGSGGTYASDDDPELIRETMPFGLKTYESLLEVSPEHEALLLSAARGFTAYACLIQGEADRLDAADLGRAPRRRLHQPARRFARLAAMKNFVSLFSAAIVVAPD